MANETLRRQYIQIYKSIDQSREAMFGKIKASLKYSSRSSFDAGSSMLNDWGYTKKDLFLCLKEIENKLNNSELQCSLNNPVPVSLLSGDRKPQIRFLGNHHSGSGNLYHKSFRM